MQRNAVIDALNPLQQEIVLAPISNMLVIAGAGTGKTRVLISRIAYLIEAEDVQPHNILAVTFTNKAAAEMSERIKAFFNWEDNKGMLVSTFHSMCYRFLRIYAAEAMLPQDFSIITTTDQINVIKAFLNEHEIKEADIKSNFEDLELTIRDILDEIMNRKEAGVTPYGTKESLEELCKNFGKMWRSLSPDDLINALYYAYQESCNKSALLDFAELLLKTKVLLESNSKVRESLQRRYRHIFVDEFQDTNHIQYELMMLLKGDNTHIFVVGDDDQAIYGWRGADYTNLLKLKQDIPDIMPYELTINYRSTQNILTFANAVVAHNQSRILKKYLYTVDKFEKCYEYDLELFRRYVKTHPDHQKILLSSYSQEPYPEIDESEVSPRVMREFIDIASKSIIPPAAVQTREFNNLLGDKDASKVRLVKMGSSYDEPDCVRQLIRLLVKRGYSSSDIAILYRNNSLSAKLEEMLAAEQIPYSIYGGLKFYERAEIMNTVAYLRLMLNPKDNAAFRRIINVPKRSIGPKSVEKLEDYAASIGVSSFEALAAIIMSNDKAGMKLVKKMVPFYELIMKLRSYINECPLHELVYKVINKTGLRLMYEEQDRADDANKTGTGRVKNLDQLINIAESFKTENIIYDLEMAKELRSEIDPQGQAGLNDLDRFDEPLNVPNLGANEPKEEAGGMFSLLNELEAEAYEDDKKSLKRKDDAANGESNLDAIMLHADAKIKEDNVSEVKLSRAEIFEQFVVNASISASTEISEKGEEQASGIKLMTIHASKGLEFPAVIVVGCEKSILPSIKSDDIEEEYRLGYVAFTRAQKELYLLSANKRIGFGNRVIGGGVSVILQDALSYLSPAMNYDAFPASAFYFYNNNFTKCPLASFDAD